MSLHNRTRNDVKRSSVELRSLVASIFFFWTLVDSLLRLQGFSSHRVLALFFARPGRRNVAAAVNEGTAPYPRAVVCTPSGLASTKFIKMCRQAVTMLAV